jgi:hypothetical protein
MHPHEREFLDACRRGDEGGIDVVIAEGLRPAILNQGVVLACANQHFGMACKCLYHGATNTMFAIEAAANAGKYDKIPDMLYGPGVEYYQILIKYYPLMSEDAQYDFEERYVQACNSLDLPDARRLFPVPFDATQSPVYTRLFSDGMNRIEHNPYNRKDVIQYLATLSPPQPQRIAKIAAQVVLDDVFWAMIALAEQQGLPIDWEEMFVASTTQRTRRDQNNVTLACQLYQQHGPFSEGNVLYHLAFSEAQAPLIDLVLQYPVQWKYLMVALEKAQRLPQFFDQVETMLVRKLHQELANASNYDKRHIVREMNYRISSGIRQCQTMLMVRRYFRIAQELRQLVTPYVVESQHIMEVLGVMFDEDFMNQCLSIQQPMEVQALILNLGASNLYYFDHTPALLDKYRMYSLVNREELRRRMLNEAPELAAYIHQLGQRDRWLGMYQNGVPPAMLSHIDRYLK